MLVRNYKVKDHVNFMTHVCEVKTVACKDLNTSMQGRLKLPWRWNSPALSVKKYSSDFANSMYIKIEKNKVQFPLGFFNIDFLQPLQIFFNILTFALHCILGLM